MLRLALFTTFRLAILNEMKVDNLLDTLPETVNMNSFDKTPFRVKNGVIQ